MFSRFFNRRPWDLRGVHAPWGDRPSLYRFIAARLQSADPDPVSDAHPLPDEERVSGDGIRWVAGARDGVFTHSMGVTPSDSTGEAVLEALLALTREVTSERAAALYSLLTEHSAMDYIDPLAERVLRVPDLPVARALAVARWLASEAPDREAVKTGIALLGMLSTGEARDLLMTLGRHEEFTLFAALALRHSEQQPDPLLRDLGERVTGWGRVQVVTRLASTEDETIKAWMLREGYKNSVMDEYTALTCARTGDLVGALRRPDPDRPLLTGAATIIATLMSDGPGDSIDAYTAGAEATELYLRHLDDRDVDVAPDLHDFNVVATIDTFVNELDERDPAPAADVAAEWRRRREAIQRHIRAIQARPGWPDKVHAGLASDDHFTFYAATTAARTLDIDTWDVHFERLQRGGDYWYAVMQTTDPDRIDRAVQLAEATLPLEQIASGPANEHGLEPQWRPHQSLNFLLQDLRRFPGKGWPLVRAGLQSPVTRNRNGAVRVLEAWGRAHWPADAEPLLTRAVDAEPYAATRDLMRTLLDGKPPA